MRGIFIDPDAPVIDEQFAVVHAPRRSRDRFPENSVQIVESAEAALRLCDPEQRRFAAKVLGPSRSSEGLRLYYLVCWLGEGLGTRN